MLKIILCVLVILLIVFDFIVYFQVKNYTKIHADEPVENHKKYIISRLIVILIIGVIVAVLGIIMQFL